MFNLLGQWFQGLGEIFSNELGAHVIEFYFWDSKDGYMVDSGKNQTEGAGNTNPMQVLKGLVAARLRVEFAYYKLVDNLETFVSLWAQEEVLCSVQDGELCLSF